MPDSMVLSPSKPRLKLKLLDSSAKAPTRATPGSACIDFYCNERIRVLEGEVSFVPLGVAVSFPPEYVLLLFIRSGVAADGIVLANGTGVIDSDYRDEVQAIVTITQGYLHGTYIEPGRRICQGLLLPRPDFELEQVTSLDSTTRKGGFGHTGR